MLIFNLCVITQTKINRGIWHWWDHLPILVQTDRWAVVRAWGQRNMELVNGFLLFWSVKCSSPKLDSGWGGYSFIINKTTEGAVNFAPRGTARQLCAFGLCCFLSPYCTNSPRNHININLFDWTSPWIIKQQLPSMVSVNCLVLVLKDWFNSDGRWVEVI